MVRRKRYSSFLMLMVLMLPLILGATFLLRQHLVIHEMEEKLEKQSLQTISIHETKVVWFKKNKEILVNGKMFDVKEYHREGKHFVFRGLYDEEETAIKVALKKLFQKEDGPDNTQHKNLLKLITTPILLEKDIFYVGKHFTSSKKCYPVLSEALLSNAMEPVTPPPNYV